MMLFMILFKIFDYMFLKLINYKTQIICADGDFPIDYVHFPDKNFRDYIKNEINVVSFTRSCIFHKASKDVASVTYLSPSSSSKYQSIESLEGIQYFKNLRELHCSNSKISKIDLTENPSVTRLYCDNNPLKELNLSKSSELLYLYCPSIDLKKIDVSHCPKLLELYCDNDTTEIICADGDLPIDYKHFPDKNFRDYIKNEVNVVSFTRSCIFHKASKDIDSVTYLSPSSYSKYQSIESLEGIQYFKNLRELYCSGSKISKIDLTKNPAVTRLSCSNTPLTELNLKNCSALVYLECINNKLTQIDVSDCKNLTDSNILCDSGVKIIRNGLDINIPVEISTDKNLPSAKIGESYTTPLKASGAGTITWTEEKSGSLPDKLTLSESGIISGTPTKAGEYNFTVTATASNGKKASREFTMIVESDIVLEITTAALKNGTDGKKYSVSLKAKGAKSLKWSAENLPAGLTINESSGKISGTPTEYGDFNVRITAASEGSTTQKDFSLVISPVLPKFSGKLPAGQVFKYYESPSMKISKGSEPISFDIDIENLPDGLSFNSENGVISGIPTQGFNGKITIIARNAAGEFAKTFSLKITAEKPAITSITPSASPVTIIGKNYTISCAGTGTPPLSWDFSGFPEGMTKDVNGILSGTLNQSGKFKVNISVTNSTGKIVKKKYSLQVYNPPVITTESLDNATYKKKYSATLKATGDKTIKWRLENKEDLPKGLKFSSSGKISGTPTAAPGSYNITVIAYNSKIPDEYPEREMKKTFTLVLENNPDPKKAYNEPQNSTLETNNESESEIESESEAESINEPEKIISSNEKLFIGAERDISSLNIKISDDYIVAAVLPEIHVTESGLYELEIELDESVKTDAKLFWLACPQNNEPSEDDSIAEFYDDTGEEIFTVPENHLITVSAWLNKDIIYTPIILVSK